MCGHVFGHVWVEGWREGIMMHSAAKRDGSVLEEGSEA